MTSIPRDEEFEEMFKQAKLIYKDVPDTLLRVALKSALIQERTPKRKGQQSFLDDGKEVPDEYRQQLSDNNEYYTMQVLPQELPQVLPQELPQVLPQVSECECEGEGDENKADVCVDGYTTDKQAEAPISTAQ